MYKEKSVGIIVLNWQNWQDTLVCLDSLKSLVFTGKIYILVCDNGSTNESFTRILAWAEQHYSPTEFTVIKNLSQNISLHAFTLIQTGKNLGFAGGHNVGIRYAMQTQEIDYLWLLNNDTEVDKQALTALYTCAKNQPQVALLGSTLINYYQRNIVQCAGGCRYFPLFTMFKNVYGGKTLEIVLAQTRVQLDYVSGASMFLRVAAIKQVGLLNEAYFLFYEELDYTQRLKQYGYQIAWCQQSFVYHKGSASVGQVVEGNREKLCSANYYENLSTLKYTANFYPIWLPLVMILRFCLKTLALVSRGDFYLLIPLIRAYRDFLARIDLVKENDKTIPK